MPGMDGWFNLRFYAITATKKKGCKRKERYELFHTISMVQN